MPANITFALPGYSARLRTGAPIYVDFKSIPYKDDEVVEWRDRLKRVQRWYALIDNGKTAAAAAEMRQSDVTHFVVPAGKDLTVRGVRKLAFDDTHYQIYRITGR